MTLGQYLAMLEAGGAYQPAPAPPQAQTNIRWESITGQPSQPLPDPTKSYTYNPVEVVAERLPPEYFQPEMMDPSFRELYGGGLPQGQTIPEPQSFVQPSSFAVAEPMRMPPLPIKGAPAPKKPEPEVVESRPLAMPTDVPPIMTPTALGIAQPQAYIAMLQGETDGAKAAAGAERAPKSKPWQIGQPFQANIGKNTYTVQNYNAAQGDQGMLTIASPTITVTDEKGNEYSYRRSVAPTIFEQIETTMQQKLEESKQMMPKDGFTSYLVINGQQVPAMIQPDEQGVSRIYYQTDEMPAPAEVRSINNLIEGETFISPPDQPNLLDTIKASRRNFIQPLVNTSRGISSSLSTQYTPENLRTRLSPVWGANPTDEEKAQGKIFPSLAYNFRTDSGRLISMDEAVKAGLMSQQQADSIMQASNTRIAEATQAGLERLRYQETVPKSMTEQDIERIKSQKEQAQAELTTAQDNLQKDPGNKDLKQKVKDLQGAIKTLDKSLAGAFTQGRTVAGGGGTTIVEGMPQTVVESYDPTTPLGALNVYASGAMPGGTSRAWELDDLGRMAIDDAVKVMPSAATYVSDKLDRGVNALGNRLFAIQSDATEKMGADAPEVLDLPVTFTYIDYATNQKEALTTTIRQATTDASRASAIYQRVASDPNASQADIEGAKNQMIRKHQVLSGQYSILYPGDSSPTQYMPDRDLALLGLTEQLITPPPVFSAAIPGQRTIAPMERIAQPAPLDVVRPSGAGRQPPPPTTTDAFPLFQVGLAKKDYMRWDAGFNPFSVMVSSPEIYAFQAIQNSPKQAVGSVFQNMANSIFDEDGILDSTDQKAAEDFTEAYNNAIAANTADGKKARRAIADSFYEMMNTFGFFEKTGKSSFLDDLEKVYQKQMSAEDFLKTYASDSRLMPYFAKSTAGVETLRAPDGSDYKGNTVFNVRLPNGQTVTSTSKLYDQGKIAIEHLAYLFRNSGNGNAAHQTKGRAIVKWVANPFRQGATAQDEYSVLSVPASTNVESAALIENKQQGQEDQSKPKNLPASGIIDISGTYAMNAISSIFSSSIGPLYELASKVDAQLGGKLTGAANRNFAPSRGNLYNLNPQVRTQAESNTVMSPTTKESVVKGATYSIITYSLFPKWRFRGR